MIDKAPLFFKPYLKSVIWGGEKICQYKGVKQTKANIGESWEISAVPGHESVVARGTYKGRTLIDLIDEFGAELLGQKIVEKHGKTFPLLVKIIDAADNLSVQVHPDDSLARQRHNSLGKTEMWYIIDTDADAKIYAGLREKLTPETYAKRVGEGTFADALAVHESQPGDVFFLPAGRVHAIGAGNLLAEIQESSDVTYRIYDYDRRDAKGNPRELHTELAKDAIDYTVHAEYKSPRPADQESVASLVDCDHFKVTRVNVNGNFILNQSEGICAVIMCLDGTVNCRYEGGRVKISKGKTALIPAANHRVDLSGNGTILLAWPK